MAAAAKKEYSLGYLIGAQIKSSFPAAFKTVEKQLAASQKAVKNAGKAWADFGAKAGKLVLGVIGAATAVSTAAWKMADDVAGTAAEIGTNAAKLKMTTDGYQALEYAFRQAGLGGEEFVGAMTKLDGVLVKAASSEKTAAKFAEEYGLSAKKLASMSPEKRIERLADYLNQVKDPLERDRLAMELFGKSALEMQQVLSMGSKGMREAGETFKRTGNKIDAATIAQAQSYKKMKQELTDTISGVKTQLFSKLVPVFTNAFKQIAAWLQGINWAEWGNKIAGWAQQAVPMMKALAETIGKVVGTIWNGINAVKDFVGGWGNLTKIVVTIGALSAALSGIQAVIATVIAIKKVWTAVQLVLNVAMTANPIGLIILAIAALIAIIILVVKNFDKIVEVLKKVGQAIYNFLKPAIDFIKNAFTAIVGVVKQVFGIIATVIKTYINIYITIFKVIITVFKAIWNGIVAVVKAVFGFIMAIIKTYINIYVTIFKTIFTVFVFIFNAVKDVVVGFVQAVVGFFTGLVDGIRGIIEKVIGVFTAIFDKVREIIKGFIDKALIIFKPLIDLIKGVGNFFKGIFGGNKKVTVEASGDTGDLPGHADGGIFSQPHVARIAEGGASEAVIPMDGSPKAQSLWEHVGRLAGYFRQPSQGATAAMAKQTGELRQPGRGGMPTIEIPVTITIQGNADSETVRQIKDAAQNFGQQLRAALPNALAEMKRQETRLAFSGVS